MEMALTILMVLGIFVGIPAVIGFAISGVYLLNERKVRKTRHIRTKKEAEVNVKEPVKEKDMIV